MTVRALVYSDDSCFGRYVVDSLGGTTHLTIAESYPALVTQMTVGGVDAVILDADATPVGGLDVARHLKGQFADCPPILLVVARAADAWAALMSKADATVGPGRHPLALAEAVSRLTTRPATRHVTSRCRR